MIHFVSFDHAEGVNAGWELCGLLRRAVYTALDAEGVDVPCEVDVLLTDDEGIRALNKEQRGVDAATDVLSFPAWDFTPGAFDAAAGEPDPDTGLLPLGDVALSIDHIRVQAAEYGNSLGREAAYLTVHSILHLLGYDHLDEGEQKKQMRAREKAVMALLGLPEDNA